jgi:hypothetical protein
VLSKVVARKPSGMDVEGPGVLAEVVAGEQRLAVAEAAAAVRRPTVVGAEVPAPCHAVARDAAVVPEETLPALASTAEAESLPLAIVRTALDVAFWPEALRVRANGVPAIGTAESIRAHAPAVEAKAVSVAVVRARAHRMHRLGAVAPLETREAFALTGGVASRPECTSAMPGALVRASGFMARISGEALVADTFGLNASPVEPTRYRANTLRASFFHAKVQHGNPRVFVRSAPPGCTRAQPLFASAVSVAILCAGGLVVPAAVLVVAEGAVPALLALADV